MTQRRLGLALEAGVTLCIIGAVWAYTSASSSFFIVPLPDVLKSFRETWLFARFGSDLLPSLERLTLGFALSVVAGVVGGLILGHRPVLLMVVAPIVSFLRSMPAAALLPVAVVLLGIGGTMKVVVIAFVCVWPILLNTIDGVRELDATVLATARAYGLDGMERLRRVVVPAISPRIFAGMRTSLSLAVLMLVVSEMIASSNGIGFFVLNSQRGFAIAEMWGGILLLGILGYVLNALFDVVERRTLRWYLPKERNDA